MKKTTTIIIMLVAIPWILVLAAQAPSGPGKVEKSVEAAKIVGPISPAMAASQIIPPPKPVNAPHEIPVDIHFSAKDRIEKPRLYPIQYPANLPKEPPTGGVVSSIIPRVSHFEKSSISAPNLPDTNVILYGGDNFANAAVIPSLPYSDVGHTLGYTDDYQDNCGGNTASDVVYRYDATTTLEVSISLCDSTNFDSKLYVCLNANPNNIVACNDNYWSWRSEITSVEFIAGNSYYIVVDGAGSAYGDYSIVIYPLVDPCGGEGNIIHANGAPDGVSAFTSSRTLDGLNDSWAIDDMNFNQGIILHEVHWVCVSLPLFDWNQTADIMILADSSGTPGSVLYEIHDLPSTAIATGNIRYGFYHEFAYEIQGLNITLPAGRYWLGLRPNSYIYPSSYWETAPVQGYPFYFRMPDAGFPTWTPGSYYLVDNFDVSFCVSGEIIPPQNPCGEADLMYSNGTPNYDNGFYDFRTTNGLNNWFIIDDVNFNNPVLIHEFHWYTDDNEFDWNGTADVIIVSDDAGNPGVTLYEINDLTATREATGNLPFGLREYIYSISGLNINLPAGRYWVGLRAVASGTGASYWLTTAVQYNPSYVDYSASGYPRWTRGSEVFGGDNDFAFCVSGEIAPPPNPCVGGDAIYFNGLPDFANGFYTGRSLNGTYNEWVVDDMYIPALSTIHGLHWYTLDNSSDWIGTSDFQILADNAGVPGTIIYSMSDVPNTRIATGRTNYGLPEYLYTIGGLNLPLSPGRYWLGVRPVGSTSPNTYWETTPVSGSPVFVDYPYFGYPAWTPGNQPFGADFDVAFCLTGELASACNYVPGDVNNNGAFNGIDVSYSVGYFKGGLTPPYSCDCNSTTWYVAGDVNGNCAFNGIDVSYMVSYFKGGSAPIPCPACTPSSIAGTPSPKANSMKITN